jgi:hypothetical protein
MKVSIFILAILYLVPFAPLSNASARQEGFETWRDASFGITLTFPETWVIDERPETISVPCVLEAPSDEGAAGLPDSFGAFVMPVYIGAGYFEDVGALADVWLDTAESDWAEFSLVSRNAVETAQGYPANELVYSVVDEDDNRIHWLVWLIITPERQKEWVVGYCAMGSFDLFYQDAYGILMSAEFED